jgi:hypothetical protein
MSQSVHFRSNSSSTTTATIKDFYNPTKILFNKQQNVEQYQQQLQSPKQHNVNKSNVSLNLSTTLMNSTNLNSSSIISPNNTHNAYKYAELEHKLALTRAENQVLLEEQVRKQVFFY